MDFNAFSHGQIESKLWLCEKLEKHIVNQSNLCVLGCWYNVTGFLLLTRNKNLYKSITGIDFDVENFNTANKINNAFVYENKLQNICLDVNNADLDDYDCIISTSTEDIQDTNWFNNIKTGTLVCLQSLNLTPDDIVGYDNWEILNPNETFDDFRNKYSLNKILFEGTKDFDYGNLKYQRFMLIGIK